MLALSAFGSLKYLNSRDSADRMFSVLTIGLIKFFSSGNTVDTGLSLSDSRPIRIVSMRRPINQVAYSL